MDTLLIERILRNLVTASKQFKIEWASVTKSSDSFTVDLGDTSVFIAMIRNSFYLIINNKNGDEIGRLSGILYEDQLKELFELAKRKALKVDDSLNNLNDVLSKLI